LAVLALAAAPLLAQTFDQAVALHTAGRWREALAAYRAVAAAAAPAERAAALSNACLLETDLGDPGAALADCEEALDLRRRLADEAGVAETATNLGLALQALGRPQEAEARFREALAIDRGRGDGESVVIDLGNLGGLALAAGRYWEAMRLYRQGADLAARAANQTWSADQLQAMLLDEGVVLEKVGAYHQAVRLYQRLLAGAGGDERRRAALLVNAGVIYRNLDDGVSALAAFDRASAVFRRLGDLSSLSNVELNRGLALHLNLARPRAAEVAYRHALAFAERSGDRTEEVQDLFYLGRLLLAGGRLAEAETLFRRCLAVAEQSGSAEGRWSARDGLGRIAAARGDLAAALRLLEGALADIETVRAGLRQATWRAGYFGDKRAVYQATVEVLAGLERRQPGRGYAARAFGVVQRAMARDLLDALGGAGSAGLPRSAGELLPRLGADTLLEYFVGERRLFAWLLRGGGGVTLFDLGPPAPVGAAVVRAHHALATGGAPARRDLDALSATLLPPQLLPPPGGAQLRIAADGLLRYLPFELLQRRGARLPLVEEATLSYLPSGSALLGLAAVPAGPALAGLAVPRAPGARPLPAAERELRAVAALLGGRSLLYTGSAATEGAFRDAMRRHPRVLHLAAHAVVEEPPGEGAAIHLLPSGDDDGLLTPPEIAATAGGAGLAVLAACRTALPAGADDGRALGSLTGSFLAAHSRAVVATLWDVDDAATGAFMEQLYARLGRGVPAAEALRQVKQRLRADRRWDRPALWSAYVLVGDGGPVAPARGSDRLAGWALVVALALLGGALAFGARRGGGGSSRDAQHS
jgi:tetratricopeptide (TPR) repeat protein